MEKNELRPLDVDAVADLISIGIKFMLMNDISPYKPEEAFQEIAEAICKKFGASEPNLCKCRNDDGAMTVKRINDDFHQCPRCGGLIPSTSDVA